MDKNLRLLAVAGGALIVMACQSPTPRNVSLDQARRVYQTARADPWVAQQAALELKQARQTLRLAERVWADGRDDATTRALARMALQQVEHAREVGLAAEEPPPPPLMQVDNRAHEGGARALPSARAALPPMQLSQTQPVRLAPVR